MRPVVLLATMAGLMFFGIVSVVVAGPLVVAFVVPASATLGAAHVSLLHRKRERAIVEKSPTLSEILRDNP